MREQGISSSAGRSANPCNLWQGFADKQPVPKECTTSTDSALKSKALNPGLRLLNLLPGVRSRCKLPKEHKITVRTFKSHVCSQKERCSPAHSMRLVPSVVCLDSGCGSHLLQAEPCPALSTVLDASESSARKGNLKELTDSRGHGSVNG